MFHKATLSLQEMGVEAHRRRQRRDRRGRRSPRSPPHQRRAAFNRPFVIAILDVPTGAVLFLGQITDPTDPGPDLLDAGSR